MNNFIARSGGKRYLTQNDYLRNRFGGKVIKLSLNAGLSCPNRDGSKGFGGCTYCSSELSGDFSGNKKLSITDQMTEQITLLSEKWKSSMFIPYFQAGSNTYGEISKLSDMFEEALSFPDTVGLTIATRADCISDDILGLLKKLSDKTYLTVELGLQTIHDITAEKINRCHKYNEFLETYYRLQKCKINTCIHIINGLPGEDIPMMMQTAEEVSRIKPHSLKIHMLHIIKNTTLASEYKNNPFYIMEKEEYIKLVCDQIEIMHPEIIIERVTGDGRKSELIAPLWTCDKKSVINGIDNEFRRRNSFQGKKYKSSL
ncbi:MAG: TIGR01212 family radical SAM protein [Oscillospiraceae bacterium]|nr:TIGR01212 family radical SAM protein [Oscillospiraceae bacterium]